MARMKELEEENRRLKKMYAEAQLSTDLLKEALAKKWFFSQLRERRTADPVNLWLSRLQIEAGRGRRELYCPTGWLGGISG